VHYNFFFSFQCFHLWTCSESIKEFRGAARSLASFFFSKSSSHGKKSEQQKKMKMKKNRKNGCSKKIVELLSMLKEAL